MVSIYQKTTSQLLKKIGKQMRHSLGLRAEHVTRVRRSTREVLYILLMAVLANKCKSEDAEIVYRTSDQT